MLAGIAGVSMLGLVLAGCGTLVGAGVGGAAGAIYDITR